MLFAYQFNAHEIDEAGRVLAQVPTDGEDDSAWLEAFETVGSWRAAHAGPLRTFRSNLDRRVGASRDRCPTIKTDADDHFEVRKTALVTVIADARHRGLSRNSPVGQGCVSPCDRIAG